MNDQYDGYYEDIKPADSDIQENVSKSDIMKKVILLVGGLILFVTAAVTISMLITA